MLHISGPQRYTTPMSSNGFKVFTFTYKFIIIIHQLFLGEGVELWFFNHSSHDDVASFQHILWIKLSFLNVIIWQLCQMSVIEKYIHFFWTGNSIQLAYIYILLPVSLSIINFEISRLSSCPLLFFSRYFSLFWNLDINIWILVSFKFAFPAS